MKKKYVVWDWNGTLLDDVAVCIESMNRVLKKTGYNRVVTPEFYKENFCFPVYDYYKKLGFDFTRQSFKYYAELYIDTYTELQLQTSLNREAPAALNLLKSNGINQILLSASEIEMLKKQTENLGVSDYFSSILGIDNIYAESKTEIAKRFFESSKISPSDAVFIGDTVHDYETASAVGAQCLLVSVGHQSEKLLKESGTMIFDSLISACKYIIA